jgi:hypothetical protein
MLRDNVRMTLLHIRLVFGMLLRLPLLLARAFARRGVLRAEKRSADA